MSYGLKRGEPIPEAIERIACEELTAASDELSGKAGHNRDESIHEARKSVKKVRALLRLMRKELGAAYDEENTRLREIGRKLSDFRDTQSVMEILKSLQKKYRGDLPAVRFNAIRRWLLARKTESERQGDIEGVLAAMARELATAAGKAAEWPLSRDGFAAIAPGLESAFRAGRKALRVALKHTSNENFHEFRKRLKDHWYHVRLLEDLWTADMHKCEKRLKDLQNCLGDDHNLVVLREKLQSETAPAASCKDVERLSSLIDDFQSELRKSAEDLARSIYEEKPREFTRRIKRIWQGAQQERESRSSSKAGGGSVVAYAPRKRSTRETPSSVRRRPSLAS